MGSQSSMDCGRPRRSAPRAGVRPDGRARAAVRAAVEPLEGRALLSDTVGVDDDTYVQTLAGDPNAATTNFGSAGQLRVQDAPGVAGAQAFLRFDIDDFSGAAKAILRLRGGAAQEMSVGVWRLSDDWQEDQVTYATQPSVIGGAIDSAHIDTDTRDYYFDVTAAVRDALGESRDTVSFALRWVGGGTGEAAFVSRDGDGDEPALIVEEDPNGPVGSFNLPAVLTAGPTHQLSVTYTDPDGIDVDTIDTDDIEVSRPGGGRLNVVNVSVDAANPNAVVATYVVEGPGGSWDTGDDDADGDFYGVFVRGDEVRDTAGNPATGGPNEFLVNVPDEPAPPPVDTTRPTVTFDPIPQVTAAGAATFTITVTAADDVAVRAISIRPADLLVSGDATGSQPLNVRDVALDPTGDAASIRATFTVDAPGGSWGPEDNGTYIVQFAPDGVEDTSNNTSAAASTSFGVAVVAEPPPPSNDREAPTARIDDDFPRQITTAGGTSFVVKVKFEDNDGLNVSTIDAGDIQVTLNGGTLLLPVSRFTVDENGNGKKAEVTFELTPPGGSWDAADNGAYQILVPGGAVADAAGNATGLQTDSFEVNIAGTPPPPGDVAPPTAVIAFQPPLTVAEGTEREIRVTYQDDVGVNETTIDRGDITVARAGAGPLTVRDAFASRADDGRTVTATYVVVAPDGGWDFADNGVYAITIAADAVKDASGKGIAAAAGAFEVNIPAPPPPVDENFGEGQGQVNTGFVAEAAIAQTLAGQSEGKIVIVGREGDLSAGTSRSVVQRLNADGTPDTSFGSGGKVMGPAGLNEAFYNVTLADDGGILAAGTQNGNFVVAKFKADGSLDNAFGTGGRVVADFGNDDAAFGIGVGPAGSIVAAGGSNGNFAFAKYNRDGTPDLFFGDQGRSLFAHTGGSNVVAGIVVQPDGKIVAAGPSGGGVTVIRVNANGSEDLSFGAGGALTLPQLTTQDALGRPDRSIGLNLTPDGKIVVNNRTAGGDFAIARATAAGALDSSFGGGDGVTTVDFGGTDDADAVLVAGTGEVYAVGTSDVGGSPKAAVAAISPSGALLQGFGTGGKLTIEANVTSPARALRIGNLVLKAFGSVAPDGRLVIGTSDQSAQATSSSPLRRINVSGSHLEGEFGQIGGSRKAQKLTFRDADGTVITISLKGGEGKLFSENGNLDLILTGLSARSSLSIKASGGSDGVARFRNIMADGGLKSFNGKGVDVAGTFWSKGGLGKVSFNTLTGTVAAVGPIMSVALSGDLAGQVLSGADFGADGERGGSGSDADNYGAGQIGKLTVKGRAAAATVAAGLDPVDDRTLDGDDRIVGGGASTIGSVAVKGGTDEATRFVAGRFVKPAKLPERVKLPGEEEDPRFLVL